MTKDKISERIIEKFYNDQESKVEASIQEIKIVMDDLFTVFLESSSLEEISDEKIAEIWSEIWLDICEKTLEEGDDDDEE